MEDTDKTGEDPKKKRKKTGSEEFEIAYDIEYNEEDIDLSLNLKNPAEDRFFAYSLTLMDLYETMSDLEKQAPKEIIGDFMTALKIIKAMAEAVKSKIEIKAGLITEEEMFERKLKGERLSPENKAKLKALINHLKNGKRGPFSKDDDNEEENDDHTPDFRGERDGVSMEGFMIDGKGKSEKEIQDEIRAKMEAVLKKISGEISGNPDEPRERSSESGDKNLESKPKGESKPEKPKFLEDKFRNKEKRNEDLEM